MLMYVEISERSPRFKKCVDCVCHYRNRGPQSDRDVRTDEHEGTKLPPPRHRAASSSNFVQGVSQPTNSFFYLSGNVVDLVDNLFALASGDDRNL